MSHSLYLLDGMALAYRAHFALLRTPIATSQGFNTSAIYGFTTTLLDLIGKNAPTHLAVVFDTSAPTARHEEFPEYKANRQEMPDDLSLALPHLRRVADAFRIPVLTLDGFEADDIIGTLARLAEAENIATYMVTPDKDFGQLVSPLTFIHKPGSKGEPPELIGVPEVLARWGVARPAQVIDMLALCGDVSDNIPGVPGIGPKTAQKLLAEFDSVENLLAHASAVKGRAGELLRTHAEQALLSKRLATINRHVPLAPEITPHSLLRAEPDRPALDALFAEFEFRTLSRRVLGVLPSAPSPAATARNPIQENVPENETSAAPESEGQLEMFPSAETDAAAPAPAAAPHAFHTIADTPHTYLHLRADDSAGRAALVARLLADPPALLAFDTETDGLNPREARPLGLSLAWAPGQAAYAEFPADPVAARAAAADFAPLFSDDSLPKAGHNLKFDLAVLFALGLDVRGPLFDTMLAHSLAEPDQRHGLDHLAETLLAYRPVPIGDLIGHGKEQIPMSQADPDKLAAYAAEDADIALRLAHVLQPLVDSSGQQSILRDIEAPLIPVLARMEAAGIALDTAALAEISVSLAQEIRQTELKVFQSVGREFNLNSPKQLGEILFGELKLSDGAKKTSTGKFSTDEQTLSALALRHPVASLILEHRSAVKLKNTYVDALPAAVSPRTGRVHTSYGQLFTATGRLQSQNPNLQNIPVRTERGREIRRAFIPQGEGFVLLSADYSQIELRIIAALSRDAAMLDAFHRGLDIHAATAARIYGVPPENVTREQRSKAKMVNFGIPYGISAFGLAQRLGCPRTEAAALIAAYFEQFPGVRDYIAHALAEARRDGYARTLSGRRRLIRDINSTNGATRAAAERYAINTPIQGTAADMIKLAMIQVDALLLRRHARTRMLLQVHDELVFELHQDEADTLVPEIVHLMSTALPLDCPVDVETGTGPNWLAAH